MKKEQEKKPQSRPKTYRISRKEREYFMSNMAILMKAAVPIGEALESMRETLPRSGALAKALKQIVADIDQGISLSDALERSGIVPKQTLTMVRFGEKSGKLASNLAVAAEQERKQNIFRSKVRSAMMYPSFVFVVIIVVGLGIAWFLLPKLAVTFTQMKIELPLISKIFLGFGQFLGTNGLWFVPTFLVSFFAAIYFVFFAPGTRNIGQYILRHTPGISRLIQEIEIARFGYLFGTLLAAGVSVVESLELLRDATTHSSYKKLYNYLAHSLREGYSIKASLANYKPTRTLLPVAVQQMIIAAERSGQLAETLESIGDVYSQKADMTTENLEIIIEPIMLVIVAAGVLSVAVSVIIPIYSLVGNLGG